MKNYAHRFAAVLFQSFAGVFLIGLLDGIVTGAGGQAPFIPTYLSVFALTTSALLPAALLLAAAIAVFARGAADQTGILRAICAAIRPGDRATRVRRGSAMLLGAALMAVFVAASAIIGKYFVESMHTVIYATIATSLCSLAIGLMLLGLMNRFRVWLARVDCGALPAFPAFLLSPAGFAVICVLAAIPFVIHLWDRVSVIIDSLPLRLPALILAGIAFALLTGMRRPFAEVARSARLLVFGGIPLMAAGTLIACAGGTWITNSVRAEFTSRGILSPTAFKLARAALDFDGDGLIGFMNDGDCAPFNAMRSAGATEIPNNRIDEDCDGEDLVFDPATDVFYGKWDFDVPPDITGKRYNIVLITIDAAAPDRMSLYGYKRPTTPNLEKIAAESAWFRKAFAAGPSTRLAIPEMMTSKFGPQVDRAVGYRVPLEIKPSNNMMAEILKKAGYRTSVVVPTGYFTGWRGILQGFDRVDRSAVPYDSKKYAFHSGRKTSDAYISVLKQAAQDRSHPQFIWVHYYDAHSPYTKVPDWKSYGNAKEDVYDSELRFVDDQIGKIVRETDSVWDSAETILIITADHGEAFDSNHAVKHHGHDLYSTILHIPLLIRAPFVKPREFNGPVSALDLLPTLVNLTGTKGRFKFAGTSLVPQLIDGKDDTGRQLYSLFYLPENVYHRKRTNMMAGVRTAEYNYFKDLETNTQYLYEYVRDPYEKRNLIDEMPRAGAGLRRSMSKFLLWLEKNSVKRDPPPEKKKPPLATGTKKPAVNAKPAAPGDGAPGAKTIISGPAPAGKPRGPEMP